MTEQHLPPESTEQMVPAPEIELDSRGEAQAKNRQREFLALVRALALPQDLPWPALVVGAVYLVVLVQRFDGFLTGLNWWADAAWARVLIERQREEFGGAETYVGEATHLSTLAFLWVTRNLPFRRELWDVAPWLLSLVGAALLGWVVAGVAGRWAGALSFCLAAAASPVLLFSTLSEGLRGHTWFAMVVMVLAVVVLVMQADDPSVTSSKFLAATTSVIAGVTLASDPLFLACALLPFVLAGVTPWLIDRSRQHLHLALMAGAVAAGSFVVASGIRIWASALGFRRTHPWQGFTFATAEEIVGSMRLLVEGVLLLFNGYFMGRPLGLGALLQLGVGVGSFAALGLPAILLYRRIRSVRAGDLRLLPDTVFLVFWTTAAFATAAALVLNSLVADGGLLIARFLAPLFYTVAATLPVWGVEANWRRFLALGWGTVFVLLSVVALLGIVRVHPTVVSHPSARLIEAAPTILAFLEKERVAKGYASYWHSHPLTHHSKMNVAVSPVLECRRPSTALCRFWVNTRSDWYVGGQGRSFLLIDSGGPSIPEMEFTFLRDPPWEQLGPPSQVRQTGPFTVYIYDYDIGGKVLPL